MDFMLPLLQVYCTMLTCLSLNANPKALVVNMKSNPVADLVTLSYAKLLQQDTAEANRLLSAAQQEGIFYLGFDASHQLSELRNNVNTLFDLGAQTMENEKCELEQYSTFAGDKKRFSTRYVS